MKFLPLQNNCPPQEKARLIQELAADLVAATASPPEVASGPANPRSVQEILSQLGPHPTSEEVAAARRELQAAIQAAPQKPIGSLLGIWSHWKQGAGVSSEDIDEARREMWGEYVEGDS